MELLVNLFCKRGTYALYSRQFFHAGLLYALQPSEVGQQVAAPFLAHPFDIFQRGSGTRFATPGTVAADGEAVRLIANLLDQMQGRTIRWQL